MKSSLATLLFALLTLSLAGCSSTSTTPDESALNAADWDGPIIQAEISATQPPKAPEGCEFDLEDPDFFIILCDATEGLLDRLEYATVIPSMVDVSVGAMQDTLEDFGWKVTAGDNFKVSLDTGVFELTHLRGEDGEERLNILTGFVATRPEGFRTFACLTPTALTDERVNACVEHFQVLRGMADANRVVGIRVRGEPVTIPAGCQAMEGGVNCGNNAFTWFNYPRLASKAELTSWKNTFTETFPNLLEISVECEFLGTPVECSGMWVEQPG